MAEPWGSPPWRIAADVVAAPLPSRADVVVVGAGFAGLATAWELARRGAGVVVVEAGRVGAGASGHTGAIALEGTAIGPLADADDCLGQLARVARDASLDCDLRLDGCWEVAHDPAARDALLRDDDVPLAVADTVPGGTLDPGAALAGLVRAVQAAGGRIVEHARVDRVRVGAARGLDTTAGAIAAGRVVLAVNAYLPLLAPPPLDLRAALTLAVATAPLADAALAALGLRLPFYTADLPYLWGRTTADGRAVFGAGLVFPADGDVRSVRLDGVAARGALARLEARVRGLHPALGGVAIERRWGGPIAFVPGRPPLLAPHPDDAAVIVTAGCSGHGVALSFQLGALVARHLVEGRPLPAWGAAPGQRRV